MLRILVCVVLFVGFRDSVANAAIDPPRSQDGAAKISLFASEPDIVTPIGATVASDFAARGWSSRQPVCENSPSQLR